MLLVDIPLAELTLAEQHDLAGLEQRIERGFAVFVDVGTALMEIRDRRLYRQQYSTFEEYCRVRWGLKRQRAYELMDAAGVVQNLSENFRHLPTRESHAAALAPLEPEVQRELWQRAVESAPNGKLTAAHVKQVVEAYRTGVPHVVHNSGNNEWYTPAEYIEAARQVLGSIDLDPASHPVANEVVGARTYYTAADDGLARPWAGRIWLNPPYSEDLIGRFAGKLATHYAAGDVIEAIVLVNNATETRWFRQLIDVASAVVFPASRVRFWRPDGKTAVPLQGQALLYLGAHPERFRSVFDAFGWGATL